MPGKTTALTAFAALVEEQQRSVWARTTAMIVPAGLKAVVTEAFTPVKRDVVLYGHSTAPMGRHVVYSSGCKSPSHVQLSSSVR
jgi:hypothetical protein